MKESITKFDLEAAFKALDEIDMPNVGGLKARRAPLQEIFSQKSKTDKLIEDYYDVGNNEELDDAQKAREAEIAAAKLARIEKIVDLDAKTPEELLTSYVGKFIMQCPQCMTLFYKNAEDIEESEDDNTVVNVNEVCQHCGNESGYTLIGKVGAADEPAAETEQPAEAAPTEDGTTDTAEGTEETAAEATDAEAGQETGGEQTETAGDVEELEDLDLDLDIEDDEEPAAEAFKPSTGSALMESAWPTVEDYRVAAMKDVILDTLVADGNIEEAQLFSKLHVAAVDTAYAAAFKNVYADVDNINNPTTLYVGPQLLDLPYDTAASIVRRVLAASVEHVPIPHGADAETAMQYASANRAALNRRINESLTEAAASIDFDVSDSEWSELMNSFRGKHVSDKMTRAMLDSMSEGLTEDLEQDDTAWLAVDGFEHIVLETFEDSGYVGHEVLYSKNDFDICTVEVWEADDPVVVIENHHADNLMQSRYDNFEDFVADLIYKADTVLQEGIFDKLKKVGQKAKELGTKIMDKLKTREEKANWIFTHASLDPNKLEATDEGDYVPVETNKRFKHFAVMGFKNTLTNGKLITTPPSFNSKELVPGLKRCETRDKYEDIDKLASGWSAKPGNGPAFIYLSEDENSQKLVYLCQYFNGELVKSNDQLERYFKIARKEFEGSKAIAKAGGFQQQDDDPADTTPDVEETGTNPEADSDVEELN